MRAADSNAPQGLLGPGVMVAALVNEHTLHKESLRAAMRCLTEYSKVCDHATYFRRANRRAGVEVGKTDWDVFMNGVVKHVGAHHPQWKGELHKAWRHCRLHCSFPCSNAPVPQPQYK